MKSMLTAKTEYKKGERSVLSAIEAELEFLSEVPEGACKKVTIELVKSDDKDYHFTGDFTIVIFTE